MFVIHSRFPKHCPHFYTQPRHPILKLDAILPASPVPEPPPLTSSLFLAHCRPLCMCVCVTVHAVSDLDPGQSRTHHAVLTRRSLSVYHGVAYHVALSIMVEHSSVYCTLSLYIVLARISVFHKWLARLFDGHWQAVALRL